MLTGENFMILSSQELHVVAKSINGIEKLDEKELERLKNIAHTIDNWFFSKRTVYKSY